MKLFKTKKKKMKPLLPQKDRKNLTSATIAPTEKAADATIAKETKERTTVLSRRRLVSTA